MVSGDSGGHSIEYLGLANSSQSKEPGSWRCKSNSHLETPAPDSCHPSHVRLEHHQPLIVPASLTVGEGRGGCPVVDHRTDPECLAGVEIKC